MSVRSTRPRPGPAIVTGLLLLGSGIGCESHIGGGIDGGVGPPDAAPLQCDPGPHGPHWVLEGDPLVIEVSCATDLELDGADFTLDPLPAGASYDAASATLSWTPALDQAALYSIPIEATSVGESGTVVIGVVDRWDAPDNVPVVDPLAYPEEYDLPVFFMDPTPTSADVYTPVTVVYRGRTYWAHAKQRGGSSLSYPKVSYTVEFDGDKRFSDPDRAGGFLDKRKITLTQTFDDNSYIRTRLAFDLWNALVPGPIQVQTYSAVLFLNGEYHGLYTITDHVDKFLMENLGLLRSGNVYKAVNHDANFYLTDAQGNPKDTLHDGYEKKDGEPPEGSPGAFDDLDALVDFVANSSDADFTTSISDWIDVDNYAAWWLLVTFVQAEDTAGKNSYHYHDPDSLWYMAPWDFNAAFGQNWYTLRNPADDVDLFVGRNNIFRRLLENSPYADQLPDRYTAELAATFDLDAMLARIDDYVAEIDPSARRDEAKWQATYRAFPHWASRDDFTTYEQEIAYIRDWLRDRHEVMSALGPMRSRVLQTPRPSPQALGPTRSRVQPTPRPSPRELY